MRRFAIVLILAWALAPRLGAQPNILFLFADDQRPDTIAAWGNPNIETPNIDKLVAAGFSFKNNYCLGSMGEAVCAPSRAMLHTGQAYFRVPLDMEGHATMGETLGKAGYVTFGTGKWHNGTASWQRSFQRGRGIFFGGMADHTNVPLAELGGDGQLYRSPSTRQFSTEIFANSMIEFLENYKEDKPFYAYAAFTSPHDPRTPPTRYREKYYAKKLPLPANFLPQHPFDNGAMMARDEKLGAWPRTEAQVRDQLAEYYGMMTHLDEQVGRILAALDKTGKAENTYIIYAGDHGLAIGSHGLLGKQNIYEHSMKTPLIVKGPNVPAGKASSALTYLLDLFPTLLGLANQKPATGSIDGRNLAPIWRGQAPRVRETLFLSYGDSMRSVRDERYKLIRYPRVDVDQLFDLTNDPNEMRNLAGAADQKPRVESMMALIEQWQTRLGDRTPLRIADPEPREINMTGRERQPDPWQPMWVIEKYFPGWF